MFINRTSESFSLKKKKLTKLLCVQEYATASLTPQLYFSILLNKTGDTDYR